VQEGELFTILEQAGKRQDFHLFNRVQKLALGPEAGRALRGGPRPGVAQGSLSDDEMAEMMAEAIGNKPILPPREVRAMVKELGRDMAIEMLVAMISGSPMANVMSEKQKMQLCTALIAQALDKTPQPARRR
jgi:hypothetical protein